MDARKPKKKDPANEKEGKAMRRIKLRVDIVSIVAKVDVTAIAARVDVVAFAVKYALVGTGMETYTHDATTYAKNLTLALLRTTTLKFNGYKKHLRREKK
jgi:hypothetical protein